MQMSPCRPHVSQEPVGSAGPDYVFSFWQAGARARDVDRWRWLASRRVSSGGVAVQPPHSNKWQIGSASVTGMMRTDGSLASLKQLDGRRRPGLGGPPAHAPALAIACSLSNWQTGGLIE